MPHDVSQFSSVLVVVLVVFVVYRRFRRTFGRQVFSPTRFWIRIGIFSVIGAWLAFLSLHSMQLVGGVVLGLVAGAALAVWAASQTRFERDGAKRYFVPHTYSGLIVSALFLGRLAYRLALAGPSTAGNGTNPWASYLSSPLTLGLFFVLAGYYVCYYSLLLYRAGNALSGATALAGPPEGR